MAQNDMLMTIAGSVVTAYIFGISFFYSFLIWFVSGEILHYVFGVNTAFLRAIGITPKCSADDELTT